MVDMDTMDTEMAMVAMVMDWVMVEIMLITDWTNMDTRIMNITTGVSMVGAINKTKKCSYLFFLKNECKYLFQVRVMCEN